MDAFPFHARDRGEGHLLLFLSLPWTRFGWQTACMCRSMQLSSRDRACHLGRPTVQAFFFVTNAVLHLHVHLALAQSKHATDETRWYVQSSTHRFIRLHRRCSLNLFCVCVLFCLCVFVSVCLSVLRVCVSGSQCSDRTIDRSIDGPENGTTCSHTRCARVLIMVLR